MGIFIGLSVFNYLLLTNGEINSLCKNAVKLTSCDGLLKEALDSSVGEYSFTMCNPPFFVSEEERSKGLASRSNRRPFSCTDYGGTPEEMVTEGGEVGFVQKMVVDSLELRGRVRYVREIVSS